MPGQPCNCLLRSRFGCVWSLATPCAAFHHSSDRFSIKSQQQGKAIDTYAIPLPLFYPHTTCNHSILAVRQGSIEFVATTLNTVWFIETKRHELNVCVSAVALCSGPAKFFCFEIMLTFQLMRCVGQNQSSLCTIRAWCWRMYVRINYWHQNRDFLSFKVI